MKTCYQLLMRLKWNGQNVRSLSELRVLVLRNEEKKG